MPKTIPWEQKERWCGRFERGDSVAMMALYLHFGEFKNFVVTRLDELIARRKGAAPILAAAEVGQESLCGSASGREPGRYVVPGGEERVGVS